MTGPASLLIANLIKRKQKDGHNVVGIEGPPGVGKSTIGIRIARKVEPDFSIENVHYNRDDWQEIISSPKGSTFLLDEGANIAMNRTWMEKTQTKLMQILNMIRQRNHTLIWATPNLARLDIVIREDLLTHKLQCYPTPSGPRASLWIPKFTGFGERVGWRPAYGRIKWQPLDPTEAFTKEYLKRKAHNFQQASNSMSHLDTPYGSRLLDETDVSVGRRQPGKTRRDPLQRKVPQP